jgi:hypothetical protein
MPADSGRLPVGLRGSSQRLSPSATDDTIRTMSSNASKVAEILRTAHEAVKEAGVPTALQPVAFEKAVDLLAAAPAVLTPITPPAEEPPPKPQLGGGGEEKTLARLAAKLGVTEESVGEVFYVENDALAIGIGTSKLGSQNKEAVQQLALLVAAGRQGGGWDAEWTNVSEIRPVADAYGKVDTNFATTVKGMDDVFTLSGNGANRKLKVKRKGYEDLAALVKTLAGEE